MTCWISTHGQDAHATRGVRCARISFPACIFTALLALSLLSTACLQAGWRENLTPDVAGPFPAIRPFEAEFRIGWSEVEAARATVNIGCQGNDVRLSGFGGTTGLARMLWQLDASLDATTAMPNFQTVYSMQQESYSKRTLVTEIVSKPDGIWRLRENYPQGENPARWKKIKISPLRDLFSGMLYIRSRRLDPGETVSTIIYPGDSPYLVEMKCLGTEKIPIAGSPRDAIKLDLRIRRINLKKENALEPHGKFQNGTVWLSNDPDRIPLRAEVNIFIGYVFAELESINFKTR
ncbi:MAG: DUF3108 domain-containing protein [Verrucomicrobia bacterium]|nr:DUF3108 domain-containing protein [Verrucomicrobiota bacterium]